MGGDDRGRAAGRTAGNAPRRIHVHRCAVVRILAREAPGQFFGMGLTDEICARVKQPLNDGRRARRGLMCAQPVGTAEAGPVARDIIDVLDSELKPMQRPVRCALDLDVSIAAKGSEPVVDDDLVHWIDGTQINTEQCNSEARLALLGFVWTVSNSGPLVKSDRGNHRNLAGSGTDENLVLRVLTRMWLLAKNILFQSQSCSARRASGRAEER